MTIAGIIVVIVLAAWALRRTGREIREGQP
jgi:hypothetical protein